MVELYAGIKKPLLERYTCKLEYNCNSVPIEKVEHILFSPIWVNSSVTQGQHIIIQEKHRQCISNIIDLLDLNGQFCFHFEDLELEYTPQNN